MASDQRMGPGGFVMTNDNRLKRSGFSLFVAAVGLAWATTSAGGEPDQNKVDFNFQVRPILSDKCFKCHGPDAREPQGRAAARHEGGGLRRRPSRAPAPSCRATSRTASSYRRITAEDETERMPPKSLGRSLSPEEIDILKRWIEQGAEWKPHWSFLPPVAAPVPDGQGRGLVPQPDRPVRPGPPGGRAVGPRPPRPTGSG